MLTRAPWLGCPHAGRTSVLSVLRPGAPARLRCCPDTETERLTREALGVRQRRGAGAEPASPTQLLPGCGGQGRGCQGRVGPADLRVGGGDSGPNNRRHSPEGLSLLMSRRQQAEHGCLSSGEAAWQTHDTPKIPKRWATGTPPRLTGASRGAFPPPPEGTLCCGVPSRSPSTPAGARPPCRPFAVLPTEIKSSHPLSCPRGPNSLKEGGLPFPLPPSCHLLPHKDGSVASSSWTSGDMSTGLEPLTLCTERRQDDVLREPPPNLLEMGAPWSEAGG